MTDERKVCNILNAALMTAQIGGMSLERSDMIGTALVEHYKNLEDGAATVLLSDMVKFKDKPHKFWKAALKPAIVGGMSKERAEAIYKEAMRCDRKLVDWNRQNLANIIEQTAK